MIIEQRTYDFHPGAIPKFFNIYEETGARELQMRILGNLVGYYMTELGPLNQTVHLWGYASLDDRAARRTALMQEDVWRGFLGQILPLLQRQESKILLPQPFSPIPGKQ
ncbi:NIPSNAP family protein [Jannaschia sp. CCS1]|uniref:NIPSNAP family protein n=1 Tax=Jannaschia sp. (strain CCS1) TaxID=290400 RepID=UPI000053A5B1|nr:NIPSNAP family protein [Jannaschia sp. CCS1]ABD55185.1 NIPSNAP [Jannaschia sp. CCS1]